MKKLLYNVAFLTLLPLLSWSVSPDGKEEGLKGKIRTHFTSNLEGNGELYTKNSKFNLKNLDLYTSMVWEQWVEANNNYNEQKLIDITELWSSKPSHWDIPNHLEEGVTMPYYFGCKGEDMNTKAVKPTDGYPLFIYLHGSGPKDREWLTGHKLGVMFKDSPSVYFIPQIPSEKQYRWWNKSKQYAIEKLLRLIHLNTDMNSNRIYLFGISEGGYGSQRLASFYADYLAGAGPMAGGEPLRNAPVDNCRNIAFSMLTGANDLMFGRNVLTQITADTFNEFQKDDPEGYNHRIEVIPGRGHQIDYRPTTVWLKDFKRNPYPKRVVWENFEMDGIYRKGFHNLAVLERSNIDNATRTRYIMDIKENHISLSVDLVSYSVIERNRWNVETKYEKSYTPAQSGKVLIYLNNHLVDLSKVITVTVNGKQVFKGRITPNIKHLINSCTTFFDSERLYPAAIEVKL